MLESCVRGISYGEDRHLKGRYRVDLCLFATTRDGGYLWFLSPWGPPYYKRENAEAAAKQMSARNNLPLITGVKHGDAVAPALALLLKSGVAGSGALDISGR